jgi:DNA-binding transcriptional LysR family regulator
MLLSYTDIAILVWLMDETERIGRRIKLSDLRLLVAIIEEGSMSKAAERLATAQPAISRTIADLERSLGVRLLDRGPHGIAPTPFGRVLFKRSITVFDELRSGLRDLKFLADPTAGEVRIAAPLALSTGFLAEVINRLNRHYPGIACHITTGESPAVLPLLEKREVDFAITFITNDFPRDSTDTEVLFPTEPVVVVASAKNPWTQRRGFTLADLLHEPWALAPPLRWFNSGDAFRAAGLNPPSPKAVASSIPARLALVARGRFLTITSKPLLQFAGAGLALKPLPVHLPTMNWPQIGVVTLKNRTLTPVAQLFVDCAREVAKPLMGIPRKPGSRSKPKSPR